MDSAVVVLFILPFANGLYNPYVANIPTLFWVLDSFQYIVVPGSIAVWLATRAGLRSEHIGLQLPRSARAWQRLVVQTVLVSICFHFGYEHLLKWLRQLYPRDVYPPVFSYQSMTPDSRFGRFLITAYYGVTAGLVEEFYYRGVLTFVLGRHGMGRAVTVLVTSSIFSIVHWEGGPAQVLAAFTFGVLAASYYVRTRLLWPLVIAHCVAVWLVFFQAW